MYVEIFMELLFCGTGSYTTAKFCKLSCIFLCALLFYWSSDEYVVRLMFHMEGFIVCIMMIAYGHRIAKLTFYIKPGMWLAS